MIAMLYVLTVTSSNEPGGRSMRKLSFALAAATLALACAMTAGVAQAKPIIVRDTVTSSGSETGLTDDCRPGLTGTINGTDVFSYQSVESDHSFHIHGTFRDVGRIDWSDGSYTLINSVDHFSFNAAKGQHQTFAETHVDTGDFYSSDGVFELRVTFHEVEHFTVGADGAVRVQFERGHFHFSGAC
jgi:hypothetical protein